MVRPASAEKPAVKKITDSGVGLRIAELSASEDDLTTALSGIDVLISAIGPHDLLQQKALVRAAKNAGVKRFIPCAFITVAPPSGVMMLRDDVSAQSSLERYLCI